MTDKYLTDTSAPSIDADIPCPRVGASTIFHGDSLYLWGGRGGVDMAPLPHRAAGPWKSRLTGSGIEWKKLCAVNEDEAPEPRSYHVAVVHDVCPLHLHLNSTIIPAQGT